MTTTRPGEVNGLLNLDKPKGWTSHDVVARVRRLTGVRRVGHAGTLDPMATGVLVLCLGRATRLVEYVMGRPKVYLAEITLGIATDTYDATGTPIEQSPIPSLDRATLDQALDSFRGQIRQRPPAYSAIKRDGQALYHRARRGEKVETEPRPVTVYELALRDYTDGVLKVRIRCSSGTYVRAIAHDLGQVLGCSAHLSRLQRTSIGTFSLEAAHTLEDLAAAAEDASWLSLLLPMAVAVSHLPAVELPDAAAQRLLHGQPIPAHEISGHVRPADDQVFRALDGMGRLLALVLFDPSREAWQPLKVLRDSASPS